LGEFGTEKKNANIKNEVYYFYNGQSSKNEAAAYGS